MKTTPLIPIERASFLQLIENRSSSLQKGIETSTPTAVLAAGALKGLVEGVDLKPPSIFPIDSLSLSTLFDPSFCANFDLRSQDKELGVRDKRSDERNDHLPEPIRSSAEGEKFFEFIRQPSTHLGQIQQRQKLLYLLMAHPDLSDLAALKNQIYLLNLGVKKLFEVQKELGMSNIEAYHSGQQEAVRGDILRALDQIETGRSAMTKLIQKLAKSTNPVFVTISEELAKAKEQVKLFTNSYFLKKRCPQEATLVRASEFHKRALQIGIFIEFASVIQRERYSRASFDPARPLGYQMGWNFTRRGQVKNNSPADQATTVYSGSNMSGKSSELKKQFFMQLLAQSFGYVPCQNGNFGIYDSFHYLDRASTDHSINLSAFGREVRDWNTTISLFGKRPFLCCDEGFSTTSAVDQFRLLMAVHSFLQERNARVYYASHNELFLEQLKDRANVGIYRMRVSFDRFGKVQHHYHLENLPGDSMALPVASSLGFPSDLIATAKAYLEKRSAGPQKITLSNPPVLQRANDPDRESQKLLIAEPACVVSDFPEEVRLFHIFSEDTDFEAKTYLRSSLYTGDILERVPHRTSVFRKLETRRTQYLQTFLMDGIKPETTSEVLERQKTFSEIIQKDLYEQVLKIEERLLHLVTFFPFVLETASYLKSFNKEIQPVSRDAAPIPKEVTLAFFEMNRKLLGNAFPLGVEYSDLNATQLPAVSLFECDLESIRPELQLVLNYWTQEIRQKDFFRLTQQQKLVLALSLLVEESDSVSDVIGLLKSFDSVETHQMAIGLQGLLEDHLSGERNLGGGVNIPLASGPVLLAAMKKLSGKNLKMRNSFYLRPEGEIQENITKTTIFFMVGAMIRAQNQAPVIFNETGELSFRDAWNLFDPKQAQAVSDISFEEDESLKLINGANMSGKTYWLKKGSLAILWAQMTGYAPAKAATMPVYDAVIYLDRVRAKSDRNLSAFGNEVQFWNRYLSLLSERKNALIISFMDEIFSTTSPRYQAALTYAVTTHAMALGQRMIIASHNHDVIDRLKEAFPNVAIPYHFAWHNEEREEGSIFVPEYQLRRGHVDSNAIEVARTLGMHQEILKHAIFPLDQTDS